MPKIIASAEFENEVIKSSVPVMVDFYAEWCVPCKMIAPMLDELENESAGKVKLVKVDIDKSSDLVQKYRIAMVPTLMFFKNGDVVDRVVGGEPKNVLASRLNNIL